MTKCNFIKQKESKFLFISGEDSKDFLQSLITNDINKCSKSNSIYSCLLSPQGKFIADFFITTCSNKYLIEIHQKLFEYFLSRIKIYKLRSNIEIKENLDFNSVIFLENNILKEYNNDIIYFKDPRNNKIGNKAYIKKDMFNDFVNELKLHEINFNIYRELLMKNLIPYSVEDLIVNKSLLLENNFQNLNAIDWDKGCYVGQEITARMKYRSLLKKNLRTLKILSGNISINSKIFDDNNEIGEIVSFTKNFAFGMLNIQKATKIIKTDKILSSENAKLKIIG